MIWNIMTSFTILRNGSGPYGHHYNRPHEIKRHHMKSYEILNALSEIMQNHMKSCEFLQNNFPESYEIIWTIMKSIHNYYEIIRNLSIIVTYVINQLQWCELLWNHIKKMKTSCEIHRNHIKSLQHIVLNHPTSFEIIWNINTNKSYEFILHDFG